MPAATAQHGQPTELSKNQINKLRRKQRRKSSPDGISGMDASSDMPPTSSHGGQATELSGKPKMRANRRPSSGGHTSMDASSNMPTTSSEGGQTGELSKTQMKRLRRKQDKQSRNSFANGNRSVDASSDISNAASGARRSQSASGRGGSRTPRSRPDQQSRASSAAPSLPHQQGPEEEADEEFLTPEAAALMNTKGMRKVPQIANYAFSDDDTSALASAA